MRRLHMIHFLNRCFSLGVCNLLYISVVLQTPIFPQLFAGLPGVRYVTGPPGILALFSGTKMIVKPDNACVNSPSFCATDTGTSSQGRLFLSEAMMHFPPVSDFPSYFKKNSDSVENFPDFTFSKKVSIFVCQNFL